MSNTSKLTSLLTVLFILQLGGLVLHINFLSNSLYLASPFCNNKSNTFMDFFNTMFYAFNDNRYSEWFSVYPPLNFLFLQAISYLDIEAFRKALSASDLQSVPIFIAALISFFFISPALLLNSKIWKNVRATDRLLVYLIFITSIPFLFCLERGNLVILSLPLIGVVMNKNTNYGPFAIAMLTNLKPYFAILAFAYLCKRDYKNFFKTVGYSLLVFLLTAALIRDKNFLYLIPNLLSFSNNNNIFPVLDLLSLPSSLTAYAQVLMSKSFLQTHANYRALIPFNTDLLSNILMSATWVSVISCLTVIFIRGKNLDYPVLFMSLILIITNISHTVGGYSLVFYLALLPIINTLNIRNIIYILLIPMFLTIADWIHIAHYINPGQHSYISGQYVNDIDFTLGVGSALRPLENITLLLVVTVSIFLNMLDIKRASRSS